MYPRPRHYSNKPLLKIKYVVKIPERFVDVCNVRSGEQVRRTSDNCIQNNNAKQTWETKALLSYGTCGQRVKSKSRTDLCIAAFCARSCSCFSRFFSCSSRRFICWIIIRCFFFSNSDISTCSTTQYKD